MVSWTSSGDGSYSSYRWCCCTLNCSGRRPQMLFWWCQKCLVYCGGTAWQKGYWWPLQLMSQSVPGFIFMLFNKSYGTVIAIWQWVTFVRPTALLTPWHMCDGHKCNGFHVWRLGSLLNMTKVTIPIHVLVGLYANEWLQDTNCHAEVGHHVPKVKVLAHHEYAAAPCFRALAVCILSIIKTIKSTFNNYYFILNK